VRTGRWCTSCGRCGRRSAPTTARTGVSALTYTQEDAHGLVLLEPARAPSAVPRPASVALRTATHSSRVPGCGVKPADFSAMTTCAIRWRTWQRRDSGQHTLGMAAQGARTHERLGRRAQVGDTFDAALFDRLPTRGKEAAGRPRPRCPRRSKTTTLPSRAGDRSGPLSPTASSRVVHRSPEPEPEQSRSSHGQIPHPAYIEPRAR